MNEGEGAILDLHDDAVESSHGEGEVDEVEDDGLVSAEHLSAGDSEDEGVGDLSSSSGNGDSDGLLLLVSFAIAGGNKLGELAFGLESLSKEFQHF